MANLITGLLNDHAKMAERLLCEMHPENSGITLTQRIHQGQSMKTGTVDRQFSARPRQTNGKSVQQPPRTPFCLPGSDRQRTARFQHNFALIFGKQDFRL